MLKRVENILPEDFEVATLVGRLWHEEDNIPGVSPVLITPDGVYDLSVIAPTCSELMNSPDLISTIRGQGKTRRLGDTHALIENTLNGGSVRFLSPIDLQAIKACGVTFVKSMLERVIEERAGGDSEQAEEIRIRILKTIGGDSASVVPGSKPAELLKTVLQESAMWSQYLEVGIGPDAEVFTKAPVLSSVGLGTEIGLHPKSGWNNPEPEAVLIVDYTGQITGATLGNDVNLRDFEGRSALLLGKSKDNNASTAIGPFIRLVDDHFTLDHIRQEDIHLTVSGNDGFELNDVSSMSEISRDILDLVSQTINDNHQYPDGFALFLGTMFAPTQDRGEEGTGFTHNMGDVVEISSRRMGRLINTVTHSNKAPEWTFGINALIQNLIKRGLLSQ
jgi:fumarylacetoacetate (FAA) hydrolase family protein